MYEYVKKGKVHEKEGLKCQDVVAGEERAGIIVLAAADGASLNDYGRRGAELTVQTLLELFLNYFQELYCMAKPDIQFQIIEKVRERLYEECDRCNVKLQDMKSTFIAVAYEKETGKMIRVHLGDGYVVVKEKGVYRFHSYPENKGNRYQTFLTNMIPVSHRINVFVGKEDVEEICLLTDGWLEIAESDKKILELIEIIKEKREWESQDDLGFISEKMV